MENDYLDSSNNKETLIFERSTNFRYPLQNVFKMLSIACPNKYNPVSLVNTCPGRGSGTDSELPLFTQFLFISLKPPVANTLVMSARLYTHTADTRSPFLNTHTLPCSLQ